jgi:hypothetical protein
MMVSGTTKSCVSIYYSYYDHSVFLVHGQVQSRFRDMLIERMDRWMH